MKKDRLLFTADLPVDGKYYVKEIFAPDGCYNRRSTGVYLWICRRRSGRSKLRLYFWKSANHSGAVQNRPEQVRTSGAHLKVTDSDSNTVDEWTSTEESHVIKELVVGKEYTMTEQNRQMDMSPQYYLYSRIHQKFRSMRWRWCDKVEISKTDITGETEIQVKLTILDKDDQVVESWTSREHYIEKLPIGKYLTWRAGTEKDIFWQPMWHLRWKIPRKSRKWLWKMILQRKK